MFFSNSYALAARTEVGPDETPTAVTEWSIDHQLHSNSVFAGDFVVEIRLAKGPIELRSKTDPKQIELTPVVLAPGQCIVLLVKT